MLRVSQNNIAAPQIDKKAVINDLRKLLNLPERSDHSQEESSDKKSEMPTKTSEMNGQENIRARCFFNQDSWIPPKDEEDLFRKVALKRKTSMFQHT